MAFIPYPPADAVPRQHAVPDPDNIVQIHRIHPAMLRLHHDLYLELMRGPGPLRPVQREMIATVVSATNGCHY